jgi:hypothetical protein
MTAPHGYLDANAHNHGRPVGRLRKADPIDHTYYLQAAGDTAVRVDPRQVPATNPPRWRATCDVCPWLGDWHEGYPDGPIAADADGAEHRVNSRGLPGWAHCPDCGRRRATDALCDICAARLEDHYTDNRKDPWAS